MRAFVAVVFLVPAIASSRADAKTPSKPAAASTAAPANGDLFPPPGTCNSTMAGIKVCTARPDGQGAFDVLTSMPAAVFVRTEDPIVSFVPPDDAYFQVERQANSVVIAPTKERIPESTPTIITTKTLTVTLHLKRASGRLTPDTQVTLHDPLKGQRSAEVAQAIAEAEKRTEARVTAELRGSLLDDYVHNGIELHSVRGHSIARNASLIVLEATQIVRTGSHRMLFFEIENRSGDPFQVKNVRAWVAEHEVPSVLYRLDRQTLAPAEVAHGALELPAEARAGRMRLLVEEVDSRRNVELTGVELR